MQAKAAVLKEFGKDFVIETVTVPEPGPDEVLVLVRASGLCGTDIHIQQGLINTVKVPYVPGHEMAGEIYMLGKNVDNVEIGDHVVVHIDIACQKCRFCRTGRPNLCRELVRIGFETDGSHQEYAIVPKNNVYKVSKDIPFEDAAIIPDAIACTYHSIKEQGKVTAGDKVCILGVGGLGFHAIQIAKYFGADVIATSRNNEKLEIAKNFGADYTVNTREMDLVEEVEKLTGGDMCDVIFDNIGIESSVQLGLDICRPGGKVIIVGYSDETFYVNYQDIMKNEKEIIGMRGSTPQEMIETIKMVENNHVIPYVYRKYKLSEINEAITNLKNGKSYGRSVIMM